MIGLLQFGTGSGSGMCPPSALSGFFWELRPAPTGARRAATRSAAVRIATLAATLALAPDRIALRPRRWSPLVRLRRRAPERGCANASRRVIGPPSPARSTGVPAAAVDTRAGVGAVAAEAAEAPEAALELPPAAAPPGGAAPAAPPLGVVTGTVLVPPGGRPGALPVGDDETLGEDPPTDTLTNGAPEDDPPTETPTSGAPEEEEEEEEEEEDPPTETLTTDPSDEDSVAAAGDVPPSETSTNDPLPDDPVEVAPPSNETPSTDTCAAGVIVAAARAVARPVASSDAHRQAHGTSILTPTPLDSRVAMATT